MVCVVLVGTAIRHSTRCAGRRGRKRPHDGRHNSCCARLQYQQLQRRMYRGQFLYLRTNFSQIWMKIKSFSYKKRNILCHLQYGGLCVSGILCSTKLFNMMPYWSISGYWIITTHHFGKCKHKRKICMGYICVEERLLWKLIHGWSWNITIFSSWCRLLLKSACMWHWLFIIVCYLIIYKSHHYVIMIPSYIISLAIHFM